MAGDNAFRSCAIRRCSSSKNSTTSMQLFILSGHFPFLPLFIHYVLLLSLISRVHICQRVIPANTSKFRNFGFMGLIALRGLVCISPPKHIIVTEILSSCTLHSLSLPLIAVGRNRDLLEQLAIQCCERAAAQVRLPPLDLASPSCKEKVPGYIISAIRK